MPEAWERQTEPDGGEPAKAFHAFTVYRDLGPKVRSLEKVAAAVRAPAAEGQIAAIEPVGGGGHRRVPKSIEMWSKTWRWPARALAWDEEQDRQKREAMAVEIQEMGKRQAQQAQAAAHILTMPFMAINKKLKAVAGTEAAQELEKLPFVDLLKMSVASAMFLRTMHQAEREARGVDTMAPASTTGSGPRGEQTVADKPQVTITAAEFTWVQGRCTCGHTHSAHDQAAEDPMVVPCTVEGCGCRRYRDADEAEANA